MNETPEQLASQCREALDDYTYCNTGLLMTAEDVIKGYILRATESQAARIAELESRNKELGAALDVAWNTLTEFGSPQDDTRAGMTLRILDAALHPNERRECE